MEIASPQPVAVQPTPAALPQPLAEPSLAAPAPTVFKNQDRFNELAERIANKGGAFSETEQDRPA